MDPLFYQAFLAFDSGRYDEAGRFYALALAKYSVSQYEHSTGSHHNAPFAGYSTAGKRRHVSGMRLSWSGRNLCRSGYRARTCFSLSGQAFEQAGDQVAAEEVRRFDMALGCTGGGADSADEAP
jgi:hypothetical protein